MLSFVPLRSADFDLYADDLFAILWGNMNEIAPSGCSYGEDFAVWSDYNRTVIESGERKTVLFIDEDSDRIAGYFQYRQENNILWFDEIESLKNYQGKGLIYRPLLNWLLPQLPDNIDSYQACIHKENTHSSAILKAMGAEQIGQTPSGNSLLYHGKLAELERWLKQK